MDGVAATRRSASLHLGSRQADSQHEDSIVKRCSGGSGICGHCREGLRTAPSSLDARIGVRTPMQVAPGSAEPHGCSDLLIGPAGR